MRPITFSFPAPNYSGIAATQNITTSTGAYVVLNGTLTNYAAELGESGAVRATFPGIQRTVGIFSTGQLQSVVFYASGLDLRGAIITASFVGPSGGSSSATDAFATALAEFNVVNCIFCTAVATSNFTVGTGATGATNWARQDTFIAPFNVTVSVITATAAAITIQDTPNNPNTSSSPTVFSHATLAGVTSNQQSNYTSPVQWVRGIVTTNSATGAGSTISLVQSGNGA